VNLPKRAAAYDEGQAFYGPASFPMTKRNVLGSVRGSSRHREVKWRMETPASWAGGAVEGRRASFTGDAECKIVSRWKLLGQGAGGIFQCGRVVFVANVVVAIHGKKYWSRRVQG